MSFCRNCGAKVPESGVCMNCVNVTTSETQQYNKWSILAIIIFNISVIELICNGFFTFLNFNAELMFLYVWVLYLMIGLPVSLVYLAMSIVAVCLTVKQKQRGKGLAIASLVLNILSFCMAMIIVSYIFFIKWLA